MALDCISKYDLLQESCGFTQGVRVTDDSGSLPEKPTCVRLDLLNMANGCTVKTDTPSSKVVFAVNGFVRCEAISDKDGVAVFEFTPAVNLSRIHCAQLISSASLLEYFVQR